MLDLAGAQYGHYQPVVPLHQYIGRVREYVRREGEKYRSFCRDRIKQFNLDQKDVVGAICRINLKASQAIECAIDAYEREHHQIRNLLDSQQENFDQVVSRVVYRMRQALVSTLNDIRLKENTARQEAAVREEALEKEAANAVDVEGPISASEDPSSLSPESLRLEMDSNSYETPATPADDSRQSSDGREGSEADIR